MDVRTRRSLEWDRVLALLSLCASTEEGRARAGTLQPKTEGEGVRVRHARVGECLQGESLCGSLTLDGYRRTPLRVPDGVALPIEVLRSLRTNLRIWERTGGWLRDEAAPKPVLLEAFPDSPSVDAILARLEATLDDRGEIADGASPRLRSIRGEQERSRGKVFSRMQSIVENLGSGVLRDTTYTIRGGRLVLPVQSSSKGAVTGILHDTSSTGATTFIEPMEVVELNNRLAALEAEEREEIQAILVDLSAAITECAELLGRVYDFLESLDVDLACARFGRAMGGRLPETEETEELVIRGARHPLLDPALNDLRSRAWGEEPRDEAVPLDLSLSLSGTRTLVVSGPNAGGKSVALKTVGLVCAMHQSGIPCPVSEGTRLPVFPFLHATVGDAQSILDSLSTFSARMADLKEALGAIEEPFLVLLDELGSGTDPAEGAALGQAVLDHLHGLRGFCLCSTHYEALKAKALVTEGMGNACMAFEEKTMAPTFRMQMDRVGASRALEIAQRSGLPEAILSAARAYLPEGEKHLKEILGALEEEIAAHGRARSRLDSERREIETARRAAKEASRALEEEKRAFLDGLPGRLKGFTDLFAKDLKAEVDRQALRRVSAKAIPRVTETASASLGLRPVPSRPVRLPAVGDWVRVGGMGVTGEVREVDLNGRITLEVNGKTLRVSAGDVEPAETPAGAAGRGGVELAPQEAGWEINLIGQTVAEAEASLEPFMDRAAMAGLSQVRVIHGIGTGRLKRAVREWAARSPLVAGCEDAPPSGGGPGATLMTLEP